MRKWTVIPLVAGMLLGACNTNDDNAQQNTPVENADRDVNQFGNDVEQGMDNFGNDLERGAESLDDRMNQNTNEINNNQNGTGNGQQGTTDQLAPGQNDTRNNEPILNEGR